MQKLFTRALSPIFANIAIDRWDDLDEVEVRHLKVLDVYPLVIYGDVLSTVSVCIFYLLFIEKGLS